MKNNFKLFKK